MLQDLCKVSGQHAHHLPGPNLPSLFRAVTSAHRLTLCCVVCDGRVDVQNRSVPDCEFFVNKRDFPHLKCNLTEPYDFLYPADDMPLEREKYATYTPIVSFFVGNEFADLPFPNTDDWETATGKVYPPAATDLRAAVNRKAAHVAWEDKVATAVFRGRDTGGGVEPSTNQRLRLSELSALWAKEPKYNAQNKVRPDSGLRG